MIGEWRAPTLLLLLALFGLAAAGCGESKASREDQVAVSNLVSEVPDAAMNRPYFERVFAPGAAPHEKEMLRYRRFFFEKPGLATIEGDTAKIVVSPVNEQQQNQGDQTWEAVRTPEGWKLKSAPLPPP
jgi:hypothetical protein